MTTLVTSETLIWIFYLILVVENWKLYKFERDSDQN